ncbi:hypothetical protein HYFRA_00006191 [Hymenoscyphus fraxineus]|uniref:Uncharacterized protein n=1 Tax=Hymenoscyphus fraxineus TaxID=746836 RepID=A0A9N9PP67_9HELO|nr:hypothetical protein HYFRA_00006191 [Hymenoscyphus fraxineus]
MDTTSDTEHPTGDTDHQPPRIRRSERIRENLAGSILWQSLHRTQAGNPPSQIFQNPTSPAPKANKRTKRHPIHEQNRPINPQLNSPLFNGRIPPEIRDEIFQYALTEYTKTDPSSQYAVSTNYTRPGYTGQRTVSTTLLQTCRLAYLETYHLPPTTKEHVFWHARWPPNLDRDKWGDHVHEARYFRDFQPWQMKLVKEIHFFTQLFWLEHSFPLFCSQGYLQGMEKVTITIRRGDWWWNERNAALEINPQRGHSSEAGVMKADWEAERRGQVIPWNENGWGCAFSKLKSLRELVIEFETSEDKKEELMAIVEKAATWRFPLNEGAVLSTEGAKAYVRTWEAPKIYWSDECPYCTRAIACGKLGPPTEGCEKRRKLMAEDKGPLCYIASLRWKKIDGEVRSTA